jgi:hypothetical protein
VCIFCDGKIARGSAAARQIARLGNYIFVALAMDIAVTLENIADTVDTVNTEEIKPLRR